ncbi:MAG: Na+/H+ antiporter subunit E [Pirellulaceae bacterium]|nr:Na+/H+ antiporter subunit E [Pirellulaceae bacterium]
MAEQQEDCQSDTFSDKHDVKHDAKYARRGWFVRLLPHPLLSLVLICLWMALVNSFSVGGLLVGTLFGMLIPIYTAHFWPDRPRIRKPWKILSFIVILVFDVFIANVQVAYLILFRSPEKLRSHWVVVPLDVCSAEGITALAATITLTPGTVSSDLTHDGKCLLVHCLDIESEEETVRRIKDRYERRIKAILS